MGLSSSLSDLLALMDCWPAFPGVFSRIVSDQIMQILPMILAGVAAFVVAFMAVVIGWALSLDYSAKLFTMTFVLVLMGSERASGACPASFAHL